MARRRSAEGRGPTLPEGWVVSTEYTANGRRIVEGTELSFKTAPGRFRFVKHVVNGDKEWIDVVDGKDGAKWSSFRPSDIKRVHYKRKTQASLNEDRKRRISEVRKDLSGDDRP